MTENVSAYNGSYKRQGQPGGMLLRATLAQNVGTGSAFGGLSISILALQSRYDASLTLAAMALSLTVLAFSSIGPLVAKLIARFGLRIVMCTGAATSMVGYVVLAYAPSMAMALAACGLLIGPGVALFATLSPAVLASGWFPDAPGKAMGITYLPVCATIIPLIGLPIIEHHGLKVFFLSLAGLHLLLMPLMLGIIESEARPVAINEPAATSPTSYVRRTLFWLIVVGMGLLSGMAIAGATHLLPIVTESGSSMQAGATLLALTGGVAIPGSLIAGYLCDSLGPARTLVLTALAFAGAWLILVFSAWLPAMTVAAILMGMGSAAIFPPLATLVIELFGIHAQPTLLGLIGMLTLPFTFAIPPGEGWLHDLTGSYHAVFVLSVVGCVIAMAIFFGISRYLGRRTVTDASLNASAAI